MDIPDNPDTPKGGVSGLSRLSGHLGQPGQCPDCPDCPKLRAARLRLTLTLNAAELLAIAAPEGKAARSQTIKPPPRCPAQ